MVVAGARRLLAGREIIRGEKAQHADHAVVETGADRVALPAAAAPHQGRAYPKRPVEPGDQIGDRRAGAHRRAVGLAGDAHEAAHRLGDEIEGRAVAISPAGAKAGDVAIDESGVECREPRRVEADAGQYAGAEILNQHVAPGDQLFQDRAPFSMPEIEGQRALVALKPAKYQLKSSRTTPCRRTGSPSPGVSILITSAPISASSIEQNGPARMRVRSTTRSPDSGKARPPLGKAGSYDIGA